MYISIPMFRGTYSLAETTLGAYFLFPRLPVLAGGKNMCANFVIFIPEISAPSFYPLKKGTNGCVFFLPPIVLSANFA